MDKALESKFHEIEGNNWWFKARYTIIFNLLQKHNILPKNKILDIGCSTGKLMMYLNERNYPDTTGIDISDDAILGAKKINTPNVFIADASRPLPFPEDSFDVIIASEILEHVPNAVEALTYWKTVLKKNGIILIFVPAFRILWSGHDDLAHHVKRYTKKMLRAEAMTAGLTVEYTGYWNAILSPLYMLIILIKKLFGIKSSSLYTFNSPTNAIMGVLMRIENSLILRGVRLPFGVSLLGILKKNN